MRRSTSSPDSSKVATDKKSHSQKQYDENIINQLPSASLMKYKWKKLQSLNSKLDFMENVRMGLIIFSLLFAVFSVSLLWVPVIVFGMPFYSFLLLSHSLLFLWVFIVYYQLLPPLIDERYNISYVFETETSYLPTHHPSKNEMFWCYEKVLLSVATNATIWKYLSYRGLPDIMRDKAKCNKEVIICAFLGLLMAIVFVYSFAHLGPLYGEPKTKKFKTTHAKENIVNKVNFQNYDLSHIEEESNTERIDEITKLKNEMLEKDALYTNLKKENEILRRENKELSSKNKRFP